MPPSPSHATGRYELPLSLAADNQPKWLRQAVTPGTVLSLHLLIG